MRQRKETAYPHVGSLVQLRPRAPRSAHRTTCHEDDPPSVARQGLSSCLIEHVRTAGSLSGAKKPACGVVGAPSPQAAAGPDGSTRWWQRSTGRSSSSNFRKFFDGERPVRVALSASRPLLAVRCASRPSRHGAHRGHRGHCGDHDPARPSGSAARWTPCRPWG